MTQPAHEAMAWHTAHGDVVTVFRGEDDQFYWKVQDAGNHENVGGGEGHPRRQDAITAAERHHPPVASEE